MEEAELKERLDSARARRRAAEEERASRAATQQLTDEVEAEERAASDAEAIAKAETEHGPIGKKIRAVHTDLGVIIVKRSHPVAWRAFQDKAESTTLAFYELVHPCVVHPDKDEFDRILDELPATLIRAADAVAYLAGARNEEVTGK